MDASWFNQLEGRWHLRRRILDLSVQGAGGGQIGQQAGIQADHEHADHQRDHPADRNMADAILTGDASPIVSLSCHLIGVATFTRLDAVSMVYVESGELVLRDGTRLKAVRRYLYRLEDDGTCAIDFADGPDQGRRFLRFSEAHAETRFDGIATGAGGESDNWTMTDDHLCGRDLYQVQYRFLGFKGGTSSAQAYGRALDKQFLLQRTVVSGPRKDYAIVSRLRR
jgi:hypothetical protein